MTAHSGNPAGPCPSTVHTACFMYELTIVTTGPTRGGSHTAQKELEALPSHTWDTVFDKRLAQGHTAVLWHRHCAEFTKDTGIQDWDRG